ncbi:MAG TPA: acyl-protein synthetase [Polyangiaceae bacterium]
MPAHGLEVTLGPVPADEPSASLHARVRRFAAGEGSDSFDSLALDIARFQAASSPGYARLVERHGGRLDSVARIPAVPVAAFRLGRVAAHPAELDAARFETSGTTGSAPGVHPFRTTDTYAALALAYGTLALRSTHGRAVVACLAPEPDSRNASSLAFMMRLFARAWDGHAGRWLVRDGRVDTRALRESARLARDSATPLVVLATAFALVALLDALAGDELGAPEGSAVMVTGGFKGRSREVEKGELRDGVARAFGISPAAVVGEYGMTELSSQLYEGTLPGAALSGPPDVFLEPPWLRVVPVDAVTLEPVAAGEIGIARFVDLANVDSAVAVQTDDLVRRAAGGIELLGRRSGAEPRGCSLALETLLA